VNGKRSGKAYVSSLIARLGRPIVSHLSDLAHESLIQAGSWRCLEIVYQNKPQTLLDRFFLSSRSARGARNRLRIMQEEIRNCIEQYGCTDNPVRLTSFGSGPGHEVFGSIEGLNGGIVIDATCVDKDPMALAHGKALTMQRRLSNAVRYVEGNVLHAGQTVAKQHIGVLSGLLDYFGFESATSILKMVREQLVPGGTVLMANMRQHYLASTMSVLGNWSLVYREPEEVEAILREGGYENIDVWLEPEKVFCIGKARKPT
jgi:hypothetical protein